MFGTPRRDPRAPRDTRTHLYFDYSPLGALRWYVKLSRKGRRIGIRERYGTDAFDAAYDAAVAALAGVMRKRRSEPDPLVQPERRYVQADRSQRGQMRYYVQGGRGHALAVNRIEAANGVRDGQESARKARTPLEVPPRAGWKRKLPEILDGLGLAKRIVDGWRYQFPER